MMFTGASHAMADNVKTTDRGVEIYVADASSASAGVVRLSVITDNIVRVEAVPGDSLPAPRASLMVVPQEPCGRFDCTERGDSVHLSTRTLLVSVSKATGAIVFSDRASGRVLLRETANGGKSFTKYVSPQTTLAPQLPTVGSGRSQLGPP